MKVRRAGAALVVVITLVLGVAAVSVFPGGNGDDQVGGEVSVAAARATSARDLEDGSTDRQREANRDQESPDERIRPRDNEAPGSTTTVPSTNPPATNPPATNPPATNPPPNNPPPTTVATAPPITTTTRALTIPTPTDNTIPPNAPLGAPGLSAELFEVWLRGGSEGEPDRFWWDALYLRELSFGLDTGWVDGDRSGYFCLYAFLTLDDQIVGRVTFTRVDVPREQGGNYAYIMDKHMVEGVRYYDGTLAPASAGIELGDCPSPTLAYTPYNGPSQRPTVLYSTTSGQTLEVRNYKPLVVGDGITFQQTESSPGRVTVVAYEWGNPAIVVYYESMSPNVVMSSDL